MFEKRSRIFRKNRDSGQIDRLNMSAQTVISHQSPKRKPIFGYKSAYTTNRISQTELVPEEKVQTKIQQKEEKKETKQEIIKRLNNVIDLLKIKYRQMEGIKEQNKVLKLENGELRQKVQDIDSNNAIIQNLQTANISYKKKMYEARRKLEVLSEGKNFEGIQEVIKCLYF